MSHHERFFFSTLTFDKRYESCSKCTQQCASIISLSFLLPYSWWAIFSNESTNNNKNNRHSKKDIMQLCVSNRSSNFYWSSHPLLLQSIRLRHEMQHLNNCCFHCLIRIKLKALIVDWYQSVFLINYTSFLNMMPILETLTILNTKENKTNQMLQTVATSKRVWKRCIHVDLFISRVGQTTDRPLYILSEFSEPHRRPEIYRTTITTIIIIIMICNAVIFWTMNLTKASIQTNTPKQ